jgi:hypothetical protein
MTTTPARSHLSSGGAAGRPLKSPLAVPGGPATGTTPPAPDAPVARPVLRDREQTMAEFADYLRTVNNRDAARTRRRRSRPT